jgi:hypothetical protein
LQELSTRGNQMKLAPITRLLQRLYFRNSRR